MSLEREAPSASTFKPRVALMGEFSAGKSTLANLLLECEQSPVRVTATQLPPVWYTFGANVATRITIDGEAVSIPFDTWMSSEHEDTQLITVGLEAEALETIDLIDMPGTSDPNLAVQYWKTVLPQVDLVIWCTPANQAWRQSEAALWAEVDPELRHRSLLAVTRIDQIRSELDRERILSRVRREASSEFGAVLPVSLSMAQAAPKDEDVLEASGVAALIEYLIEALGKIGHKDRSAFVPSTIPAARKPAAAEAPEKQGASDAANAAPAPVVPRRFVRKPSDREERTQRPSVR